ncbi:MAG: hypothetical protein LJE69_18660 [Thiohalocapsa sp.]|nr:hypothetical protein [Thiohalocapsa sp.]
MLAAIALFTLTLLFSSGSHPKRDFFGNLGQMEIVFSKGEYVVNPQFPYSGEYQGRVAVPIKYPLALAAIGLLFGAGLLILENRKEL